jgi:enamine deaminase RidA (YjgF/YER057c/UK114 family)
MKSLLNFFLFLTLIVIKTGTVHAQNVTTAAPTTITAKDPETRIREMGLKLRTPGPPSANFLGAVRVGNLVYLSGQGPLKEDGKFMIGKVGKEFTFEEAK